MSKKLETNYKQFTKFPKILKNFFLQIFKKKMFTHIIFKKRR